MTSKYFIKPWHVGASGEILWDIYERTWYGSRRWERDYQNRLTKEEAVKALSQLQAHEREQRMGGSQNTQTP